MQKKTWLTLSNHSSVTEYRDHLLYLIFHQLLSLLYFEKSPSIVHDVLFYLYGSSYWKLFVAVR